MGIQKTDAILLRQLHFRNTSQIVTFLSGEHGILPAIAKGSRRPNNGLYGLLDYFNAGELVYYEKQEGKLHIVSQFSLDYEPLFLRTRHSHFAAATTMAEIVLNTCKPGEALHGVYRAFLGSLNALERDQRPLLVLSAFILTFLREMGLAPSLEQCAHCQTPIGNDRASFAPEAGGCVCPGCSSAPPLAPATLSAIRYLSRTSGSDAPIRLALSAEQEQLILTPLSILLQTQLEFRLKTLPRTLRAHAREEEVRVA